MSQQLTTTTKDKIKDVMGMLEARKDQFRDLLPKYLTPEKLFRVAQTAIAKSPQLLSCTPASLVLALMDAAQTGLEVNGRDAALVPYGNQAQFQPMFHGMVKQAVTEGVAKKIQARLVYENDDFDLWYDPEPHIKHTPAMVDEGEVIGAYTYAILPDGEMVVEFMNKRKLDHIKAKAKSKSGPWTTDEEEMYRKTPTKRLFKYLPIPDRLEYAISVDNMLESGQSRVEVPLLDLPPAELDEPKQTATEKLAEKTRKTRSDAGKSRKESAPPETTSPEPAQEAISPGPGLTSRERNYLEGKPPQSTISESPGVEHSPENQGFKDTPVDTDSVEEMQIYCGKLKLKEEIVSVMFTEDKNRREFAKMTNAEAGKCLGYLLDLWSKQEEGTPFQ